MAHTREGIMAQVYVAFGQGTGTVRVSQEACLALAERYAPKIDEAVLAMWEREAVQVLERIRAMGRMAAAEAAVAGRTVITADGVRQAAIRVEAVSLTLICRPQASELEEETGAEAADRPYELAQVG